tara:strand:+ start:158 stop:637 length:480 start_codon:yes stop_codon:yes gene_type:complete
MKMKAWNWIELFGFITLAASLIFVGIQLKQNHDITLAAQYQQRASMLIDAAGINLSRMDTRLNSELIGKPLGEMSKDERFHQIFIFSITMASLDNCHYQFQEGFMTQESWDSCEVRLSKILNNCQNIEMWDLYENGVFKPRDSFSRKVNSLIKNKCIKD